MPLRSVPGIIASIHQVKDNLLQTPPCPQRGFECSPLNTAAKRRAGCHQCHCSREDAKFLAGGTNLVDLMKQQVERPSQLIDISASTSTQSKSYPTRSSPRALARNADTADHRLCASDIQCWPDHSCRRFAAVAQHGNQWRQLDAANALLLLLRSCLRAM